MIRSEPDLAPFVGRVREIAAVQDALDRGERLVTLTGLPGCGKSRVAVEVVRRVRAVDPGGDRGVVVADVHGAVDAAAICDRVAAALGVGADRAEPALAIGAAAAASGDVLVVVDGLEPPSLRSAAALVSVWLGAAPALTIVATSAAPLGIAGEVAIEIGPLDEARELFVRDAGAVGFDLSAEDAALVDAIVEELDRWPLALEIAAARLPMLGARALLHRLRNRFEVLRRDGRGGTGLRHVTLQGALESSWAGLGHPEQATLVACTVFARSFTAESAEAVVVAVEGPARAGALDALQVLRERSLLARAPSRAGSPPRFCLPRAVSDFVSPRADAGARTRLERRHAEHFVEAAEALGSESRGLLIDWLDAERDELTTVLSRVLGRGPVERELAELALRALVVLEPLVLGGGPGVAWAELVVPALDATKDSGADPVLFARALAVRGRLAWRRGRASAHEDFVRSLAAARTLGDADLEADVLLDLGRALCARGEIEAARAHVEQALARHRGRGRRHAEADAWLALAETCSRACDARGAATAAERAAASFVEAGDAAGVVRSETALAVAHLDDRRLVEARRAASRAIDATRRAAVAVPDATPRAVLARIEAEAEDLDAACAAFQAARTELDSDGGAGASAVLAAGAALAHLQARAAEAFVLSTLALEALAAAPDRATETDVLLLRSVIDSSGGRTGDARAALVAATTAAGTSARHALACELVRALIDGDDVVAPLARAFESSSWNTRAAARAVRRAIDARRVVRASPPPGSLVVGRGGAWARLPGGGVMDLAKRRPIARILDRLAIERTERPGSALGSEALLDAGWPGERVLPEAGVHRVRVAVSTLRKLGLAGLLDTSEGGYALTVAVPVVRAD